MREVLRADVVYVVAADVEAREGGVAVHERGEGDGAARAELVAGEVEARERGAGHEDRGECGDVAVVEDVEVGRGGGSRRGR